MKYVIFNLKKLIHVTTKMCQWARKSLDDNVSMSINIVVFYNFCCVYILTSNINWRSLMNMFMTFKWQDDNLTMMRCESTICFNWWIFLRIFFRSFWMRLSSKTFNVSNDIFFFKEVIFLVDFISNNVNRC